MTTILTTKLAATLNIGCTFKWHSPAADGNLDYSGTAKIVGMNPCPIFRTLQGDKIEFLNDSTRTDAQGCYWYSDSDRPVIIDTLLVTSAEVNRNIRKWIRDFRKAEEKSLIRDINILQKNFCMRAFSRDIVVEVGRIALLATFNEVHKFNTFKMVLGDIYRVFHYRTNLPYEVVDGTDKIKKDYDD